MTAHTEESILDLKIKIQRHFQELKFNSGPHTYHIGERKLNSVSSFIEKYKNDFDSNLIAGFVAKSRGITKEEVLQEWAENSRAACDLGTVTHEFAENYCINKYLEPSTPFEVAVVNFWNSLPSNYIPLCFELQMYCKIKGIAGTADVVLLNVITGKLVIADYKTNKDLHKNYKNQKLKGVFSNYVDSPLGRYTIQLSMYQLLIEQLEDIEVEERWIIWLKPDSTFELIKTDDVTNLIEKEFDF